MKDNIEQIKECRSGANKHGYLMARVIADRRLQEGQAQVYCLLCQRWRWQDTLCENAKAFPSLRQDPITREWDTPEEDEAWKEL